MARPVGSKNKVKEEPVQEAPVVQKTSAPVQAPEQFDPSIPESKQRHLR